MQIVNKADVPVSWFCFNQQDAFKLVALASGDLTVNASHNYTPPPNQNDLYFVRFTQKGGGTEFAGGIVNQGQTITLTGSGNVYQASVT